MHYRVVTRKVLFFDDFSKLSFISFSATKNIEDTNYLFATFFLWQGRENTPGNYRWALRTRTPSMWCCSWSRWLIWAHRTPAAWTSARQGRTGWSRGCWPCCSRTPTGASACLWPSHWFRFTPSPTGSKAEGRPLSVGWCTPENCRPAIGRWGRWVRCRPLTQSEWRSSTDTACTCG